MGSPLPNLTAKIEHGPTGSQIEALTHGKDFSCRKGSTVRRLPHNVIDTIEIGTLIKIDHISLYLRCCSRAIDIEHVATPATLILPACTLHHYAVVHCAGIKPTGNARIDTTGAKQQITYGKVSTIWQQAAVENGLAIGIQQNFLRRGGSKSRISIMNQQIAIGITHRLESDLLVRPVGLIHPPDAAGAFRHRSTRDGHGGSQCSIIITPREEAFIVDDGFGIGQIITRQTGT